MHPAAAKQSAPFIEILSDVDSSLRLAQGDIIRGYSSSLLPVYRPSVTGLTVVSNSCDLEQPDRLAHVAVAPIFDLSPWIEQAVNERSRKLQAAGKKPSYEDALEFLTGRLESLASYKDKNLFFFPPHPALDGVAAVARIVQITTLLIAELDGLSARRVASMKPPWRENLGYKVGFLFNRVATWSPRRQDLESWLDVEHKGTITNALGKTIGS